MLTVTKDVINMKHVVPTNQGYVCCSLYKAICCEDKCCPNGTTCSKQGLNFTIFITKKILFCYVPEIQPKHGSVTGACYSPFPCNVQYQIWYRVPGYGVPGHSGITCYLLNYQVNFSKL